VVVDSAAVLSRPSGSVSLAETVAVALRVPAVEPEETVMVIVIVAVPEAAMLPVSK
jgi:hypothetical protein